jgi:hypothetical protein
MVRGPIISSHARTCFLVNLVLLAGAGAPRLYASAPYSVSGYFAPSGWMGDGEEGDKYVKLEAKCTDNPHSGRDCEKVTYSHSEDTKGWAAIAYQYPENNWGQQKGADLKQGNYTHLTFWARGRKGGERVKFIAGGQTRPNAKYPASFEADTGVVTLTDKWRQYSIDLRGKDLSNVASGFAWTIRQADNEGDVVFFLDDIQYE